MFEQYTDEELAKSNLIGGNSDMLDELICRKIADDYKDMSDDELHDLISKRHAAEQKIRKRFGRFGKFDVWGLGNEHIFLELRRRELKRKGVTELPLKIIYSNEEMELQVKMDNEDSTIDHLEYLIEEEEKSASPNLGKIEEYKVKIAAAEKRIDELEKEIEELDEYQS